MLLVADELLCIALDDRAGRSRVAPRALGLGLAAGLLAELVLCGRLTVEGDAVRVLPGELPVDALSHSVLSRLVCQPQHTEVATWLAYLSMTAADEVGQRLTVAGVLRRVEQRRLWGGPRVRHVPVDRNQVAWRSVRLANLLTSNVPIGRADAVLAGLVTATGLAGDVLWRPEFRQAGAARLAEVAAGLPGPLRRLLAFTEAAVGDAVVASH